MSLASENPALELFARRRGRLRQKLVEHDLDGYLVMHPANRFYLSGFELHDPQCNESAGCLLITAKGEDWLCTDPRYLEAGKRIWPEDSLFVYTNNRIKDLTGFMAGQPLSSLGFESRIVCHELFATMSESVHMVPSAGLVEELRRTKDPEEIELLASSCKLNHAVFAQLQARTLAGQSEAELAWTIERAFRENGASDLAFSSIVAAGPNAALPHSIPGPTVIPDNGPLLIDIGGRKDNYCSDQTRTFWTGNRPSDAFKRTLDLVQQAQQLAIHRLRPGMQAKDLYALVKEFFARHEVAEHFTHALGHGIGLETHEAPSLGPAGELPLQPGMVITIEPGLYYPEWGGVRWEHMVVVTEDGARVL